MDIVLESYQLFCAGVIHTLMKSYLLTMEIFMQLKVEFFFNFKCAADKWQMFLVFIHICTVKSFPLVQEFKNDIPQKSSNTVFKKTVQAILGTEMRDC